MKCYPDIFKHNQNYVLKLQIFVHRQVVKVFGELGVDKGQYTGLLPMLICFIVASFSASESKTLRILKNDYEIDKNFLDDDGFPGSNTS